jgi:hypothetical protein
VPEVLIDVISAGREGRAYMMLVIFFFKCRSIILSTREHWARYLIVVPRPIPVAPRRYLIVAAMRLPAAVGVCVARN